jgi:hypothetical protein
VAHGSSELAAFAIGDCDSTKVDSAGGVLYNLALALDFDFGFDLDLDLDPMSRRPMCSCCS